MLANDDLSRMHGCIIFARQTDRQTQNPFIATTEHGKCPVRRHLGKFFVLFEVIRDFCTFLLLAFQYAGTELALLPQPLAQLANQLRVFGEALHQNLLGTIQRSFGIFNGWTFSLGWLQVTLCFAFRCLRRIRQKCVRKRLQTCFTGNLRFGAALFL